MTATAARHPPLRVWLGAALIAAVTITALTNLHHTGWVDRPEDLNLQRLDAAEPGRFQIVALGTSKTRRAMPFDSRMTRRLREAAIDARFHRITWNSAALPELRPALQRLLAHPPDLLLVESDLLLFEPWGQPNGIPMPRRFYTNAKAIKSLIIRPSAENYGRRLGCRRRKSEDTLRAYAARMAERDLSTPEQREAYWAYLGPLLRAGTRVVLLGLPRSPIANAHFPDGLREGASDLRRRLLRETGLHHWTPPRALLPDEAYCDQAHLNDAGRERYTQWLVERLKRYRATPDV